MTDTYLNHLLILNNDFQQNIETNGRFSITFDIWTTNAISYMGIIIAYINSDFNLNYKLIGKLLLLIYNFSTINLYYLGFEYLENYYIGIYLYDEFIKLLNQFNSLNLNNIFRYIILIYLKLIKIE